MAITFDSTVKGANANSYISVSRADDLIAVFGGDNATAWALLTDAQKEKLLMSSTFMIESQYTFHSYRTDYDTQALSFPRVGLFFDGIEIDRDTIPFQIEQAVARLASSQNVTDLTSDVDSGGLKSLKLAVISLEFDKQNLDAQKFPSIVDDLLSIFGRRLYLTDDPSASFSR